jgi:GH24 family phage-related lysozyme (muramidase)
MSRNQRAATAMAIATAIAIPAEGLRQYAYRDPVGVLTICYGSTTDVRPGQYAPLSECRERLDADMWSAVVAVEQCAPGLPAHQLAAFADAVFNIGPRIVCDVNTSTLARKLKAGDVTGACNELPRWDKARVAGVMVSLPGLTKRRAKERAVCLGET